MVSMLASSAVDRGFETGRVKPKTIKLVFVSSPQAALKEQRLEIGIMCPSGVTCLPAD
jgi:hypothetical protein